MGKRLVAGLALMVLLVVGAACSMGSGDEATDLSAPVSGNAVSESSGGDEAKPAAPEAPEAAVGRGDGGGSGGGSGGPGAFGVADSDAKIAQAPLPDLPDGPIAGSGRVIKNISLEVRIKKDQFQRQFARAGSLAEQFGGFVTNSQVSETDGKLASGTLTIRVPSNRFEEAVGRLKGLGKVTAEDRSGQDVSKEFVDLEARLKQAKTEEAFFLRMMDRAENISDMIQVQSQLSGVQLRIEEIQGQLNYLKDQTSLSTVSVRIYEPGAPASGNPQPLAEAWARAADGFQSVIGGLVVAVGWLAPFALIALAGLFVLKLRNRPKAAPVVEPPVA
jgi:uncharacterized protein YdcH (DUF465 family)